MKSVTNYQLYGHCAYTFVAPDRKTGANSGTTLMTGPGPHYRVAADCNCLEGKVWLGVRVSPGGKLVYAQTVPGGPPVMKLTWLQADCKK